MLVFYCSTLNFLYVSALLFSFLMNTRHCNESHYIRFVCLSFPGMRRLQNWPLVILLRNRFCVLFLREIHGPGDKENGTRLNCQRQIFTLLGFFFIVSIFRER